MRVLCKVSEREFLRLRGKEFPMVIIENEHFAILFEKDPLHLPLRGEHSWTFHFPLPLRQPNQELFIEEHSYCGPSRRPDALLVAKSVCRIRGETLDPIMEDPSAYLASSLATISQYDNPHAQTTTIKELRVSQLDREHWRLIVWVWRINRTLVGQRSEAHHYLPIIQTAEKHLQTLIAEKGIPTKTGPA